MIAIENVRLFDEVQKRTDDLAGVPARYSGPTRTSLPPVRSERARSSILPTCVKTVPILAAILCQLPESKLPASGMAVPPGDRCR